MKTTPPVSSKKQNVTVKDLKARKNPKGGGVGSFFDIFVEKSGSAPVAVKR